MKPSMAKRPFSGVIIAISFLLLGGCNEPRPGVRALSADLPSGSWRASSADCAWVQTASGAKHNLYALRINSLDAAMSKHGEHFVIIFSRGQRLQIPFEELSSFRVGGLVVRSSDDEDHIDCEVTLRSREIVVGQTFTEHCGILAYETRTHREVRIPMEEIESLVFSEPGDQSGVFEL